MMVAVAGAIALGDWAEGASVVFLFALAQVLESRAMERARGAIRALMDLAPAEALVRRDGIRAHHCHRLGDRRRHRGRPAGREDSPRRAGPRRREPRQPGADHGRVRAGVQVAWRRRFRRRDQRPRRARRAGDAAAPGLDAGADHPPRRARAGAARAEPDIRRPLRARLHADRARAGGRDRRRAAAPSRRRSGAPGFIVRSCCSSSRVRARSSSRRRCPSCRRSPRRRARACSSRAARGSSASRRCAAWRSTRPGH